MTKMLASVNSVEEALLALSANVDIIDLKQPALGSLGALETSLVKQIVGEINQRCPISATIGDLPMQPGPIYQAVKTMAETGVDYIKIGFFPDGDMPGTLGKLATLTPTTSLIAVLFADTQPDFSIVSLLKNIGFKGVMLDTLNKHNGPLTETMGNFELGQFVQLTKSQQLLCGLAGSLSLDDIPELIPYQPDYLGFRGALCLKHERTAHLSKSSTIQIKRVIELCNQEHAQAKKRILIADDNEINRMLLANTLEMNGYTVDKAADGKEALQFLSDNIYRMAFIDINMPVLSGLELVGILRGQLNRCKLTAISSFVGESQISNALTAGFDYCLAKPIDEDELMALIGDLSVK